MPRGHADPLNLRGQSPGLATGDQTIVEAAAQWETGQGLAGSLPSQHVVVLRAQLERQHLRPVLVTTRDKDQNKPGYRHLQGERLLPPAQSGNGQAVLSLCLTPRLGSENVRQEPNF